jgi:hypothetical protein
MIADKINEDMDIIITATNFNNNKLNDFFISQTYSFF